MEVDVGESVGCMGGTFRRGGHGSDVGDWEEVVGDEQAYWSFW